MFHDTTTTSTCTDPFHLQLSGTQRICDICNHQKYLLITSSCVSSALTTRIESRGSFADTDCREDDRLSTCVCTLQYIHCMHCAPNNASNTTIYRAPFDNAAAVVTPAALCKGAKTRDSYFDAMWIWHFAKDFKIFSVCLVLQKYF